MARKIVAGDRPGNFDYLLFVDYQVLTDVGVLLAVLGGARPASAKPGAGHPDDYCILRLWRRR